ncbi:MAG: PfkB family carbohydrate kinase [Chloroflexia bacterium]
MTTGPTPTKPDYLVLGHVTKDLAWEGDNASPGGTVMYSAITAQRLGLQAAIVTACAPQDDYLLDGARGEGIWVHRASSSSTTTFRNIYDDEGKRTQGIFAQATPIQLRDVPQEWLGAPIIHLGPVAQELPSNMAPHLRDCLLGITPQGWMRRWDNAGVVEHSAWPPPPALDHLPNNSFLVVSIEDLGYDPQLIDHYVKLAPLVAVTEAADGAHIYSGEENVIIPAFESNMVDATGAGDVFATALFIRYSETGNLEESARFAHAAAACAIEGVGTSTVPDRAAVENRIMSFEL